MSKTKMRLSTIFILTLIMASFQGVHAQASGAMEKFFEKTYLGGMTVGLNATNSTVPGGNITVSLWIHSVTQDITLDSLNISVYGYEFGRTKRSIANITFIATSTLPPFDKTEVFNRTLQVPSTCWDATYTELHLRGTYLSTSDRLKGDEGFSMTVVKNVYMEQLENQIKNLTDQYRNLNGSYWQLDGKYKQLNETYWQLDHNYTNLKGGLNDLDNTRRVVAILLVTTVFFIASTMYLILRKPKEPW